MGKSSNNALVLDIARRLRDEGAYVAYLETGEFGTGHLQAMVDIGWAARQAGRFLGRAVQVKTTGADEPGRLVVTAEFADGI